jgi:hypothetical protein
VKAIQVSRKGREISGNRSRADRGASTADCLSEYKLAACAWPSRAAILETTSVVDKLEIALLLTSVESSAISFFGGHDRSTDFSWLPALPIPTEVGIPISAHPVSGPIFSFSLRSLRDLCGE